MRMKRIITKGLYLISGLIHKKNDLWLFGAWEGKSYSDNSKYMFEYVKKYHPEIKAVWMTKNKKLIKTMRENGHLCYHKWSIGGIWMAFRAQVAFETEGDGDVSSFLNKTKIIQLWHGLGIKAFKWRNEEGHLMFSPELVERHKQSFWMTTSELYNQVLNELLDVPYDHMCITGYPRNDSFIIKPQNDYFEKLRKTYPEKKVIAYLPTHRNFGKGIMSDNPNSVDKLKNLDKVLGEKEFILVYKPHFHEIENIKALDVKYNNIILAIDDDVFGDLYNYVHYFDALISDYSTISYEFACTEKPVVLFPYDIDDYKTQDGGLLPYYWEYQVGPMCYTWKDTIECVENLFKDDSWLDKRVTARKAWHKYNDGNNCKRVYDSVRLILKNV